MMNKRGNVPLEEVIFVLVNLVFFSMLFFFVYNTSHSIFLTERLYAKEIALSIDSAKPGTQINIDISDLYKVASKNNFDINNAFYFKDNLVSVKVSQGEGYSYYYFTDYNIDSTVSFPEEGKAVINIMVSENNGA